MMILRLLLSALVVLVAIAQESPPAVHFTLRRRGGPFAVQKSANMTYLTEQLALAEARFNLTRREVRGNKIVRVPKERLVGGADPERLLGEVGQLGNWFATLKLGEPAQNIEMDLDLLTADFSVTTTTSSSGSRFEDLFSTTYAWSDAKPFPNCGLPTDTLVLPTSNNSISIQFPHCKPPRQSRQTLESSGSILGLAPSDSLRQMDVPTLIKQLLNSNHIKSEVFSLTLINGQEGLLSIGGTAQDSVSMIEERIERFLGNTDTVATAEEVKDSDQDAADAVNGASEQLLNGGRDASSIPPGEVPLQAPQLKRRSLEAEPTTDNAIMEGMKSLVKRARGNRASEIPKAPSWRDGWRWSPVEGASGWWQILMRGIWSDGVKIMKNQPCVVDINTPFILAPPLAAKAFYSSISGSRRLPPPYSNFYAFPCNNPPHLHFEFGGWRFPVMRGNKRPAEKLGPEQVADSKFSLGKVSDESGYCVGVIVESRMGVGDAAPGKGRTRLGAASRLLSGFSGFGESGMLAGNGMRDVWVMGEPAFRGVGIVFDMTAKEVGFRHY